MRFQGGSSKPIVAIELNSDGAKKFAQITQRNKGRPLGIFLDGKLIDEPVVEDVIPSGSGVISGGNMDDEACERLASILSGGTLPVEVRILASRVL